MAEGADGKIVIEMSIDDKEAQKQLSKFKQEVEKLDVKPIKVKVELDDSDLRKKITETKARIQNELSVQMQASVESAKKAESKIGQLSMDDGSNKYWVQTKEAERASASVSKTNAETEKSLERVGKQGKKTWKEIGDETSRAGKKIKNTADNAVESVNKIKGSAIGLKSILAKAFAIVGIIRFGKECLELGSNLSEVQNVVDTVFPNMNGQLEQFSKNAMTQFGLSETMAKQYASTFGAMSKAMGFTEQEAYNLGTSLTGLAGDVASFYNISQDVAFTKLKGVFTGETEPLKELGIVMTEDNLKAYALANGITANYSAMSQAEKVALRYKYVLENLSMASGDFAKTSNSWANQTRIASLQLQSIKASIGQGLISALTPVLRVINTVLAGISKLAQGFASLMALITGTTVSVPSLGGVANDVGDVSGAIDDASDAQENLAGSTDKATQAQKKQNKEQKKYLSGLDQIRTYTEDNDSSDSGSGGGGGGGGGISSGIAGFGALVAEESKTADDALSALGERVKELQELFMKGFNSEFDVSKFESIKENLASIGESLKDIFTDDAVKESFNNLLDTIAESAGEIIADMANIGASIADGLTGGLAKALDENKEKIKESLIKIMDNVAEIVELFADLGNALSEIFEVFESSSMKQIFDDVFTSCGTIVMTFLTLLSDVAKDILTFFIKPITDNAEGLKEVFQTLVDFIEGILTPLVGTLQKICEGIVNLYEEHISPIIQSMTDTLSEVIGIIVDGFDKYIKPVLDEIKTKFSDVVENKLNPAIDHLFDALGGLFDVLKKLWDEVLSPVITALAEVLMPLLAPLVEIVGDILCGAFEILAGIIESVANGIDLFAEALDVAIEFISPLIDFLTNLPENFTLAVETFGQEAVEKLSTAIEGIKDKYVEIKAELAQRWEDLKEDWDNLISNISDKVVEIKAELKTRWEDLKDDWNNLVSNISDKAVEIKAELKTRWDDLKDDWNNLISNVSDKAVEIKASVATKWDDLKDDWNNLVSNVEDKTANFKAQVATKWNDIKSDWTALTDNIKEVTAELKAKVATKWSDIKSDWNNILDNAKGKTADIKAQVATKWSDIKDDWQALKDKFKGKTEYIHAGVAKRTQEVKDRWQKVKDSFKGKTVYMKADVAKLSQTVKNKWSNIKEHFKSLKTTLKVSVGSMSGSISTALRPIIDKINSNIIDKIKVTIPSWVPYYGGTTVGPPAHLSYLAKGAVIPPNREFLAVLGDQKHGTNIEAPLDTIKQALREVTREKGYGMNNATTGAQSYTFIAQLDGKVIFKETISQAQLEKRKTGYNPLLV